MKLEQFNLMYFSSLKGYEKTEWFNIMDVLTKSNRPKKLLKKNGKTGLV